MIILNPKETKSKRLRLNNLLRTHSLKSHMPSSSKLHFLKISLNYLLSFDVFEVFLFAVQINSSGFNCFKYFCFERRVPGVKESRMIITVILFIYSYLFSGIAQCFVRDWKTLHTLHVYKKLFSHVLASYAALFPLSDCAWFFETQYREEPPN